MWLWKLLGSYKYIQYDWEGRGTGQKKGHEKQERYEIQDKKGKYLNIPEVTDVIVWYCFQVKNIRNQHFFSSLSNFKGLELSLYWQLWQLWMQLNSMPRSYGQIHRLTLFAMGRLKVKAPEIIDLLIHVSYLRDM